MKAFIHNGLRLFPIDKFIGQLADGDRFKTKHGSAIYTIGKGGAIKDEHGKEAFYPKMMPVIQLKSF